MILPTVLSGITKPCLANLQCSFLAHNLVSFLSSIILSLILIGVSFGLVLGLVVFGSKPSSPASLYALHHLSRLLLEYGHTLTTSTNLTSFFTIGRIHLNLSSLIVLDILIHIYPKINVLGEKPPYVLAHYLKLLTFYTKINIIISMKQVINNLKRFILLFGDILILYLSLYIALLLRYLGPISKDIWQAHWTIFSILFILWLPIYYAFNFYDLKRSRNLINLISNTVRVAIIITIVAIFYFYIANKYITITPKTILAITILLATSLQFIWRRLFTKLIQIPALEKNIIFLGYDPSITSLIYESKASGYKPLAIFDENYDNQYQSAIPVIKDLERLPKFIKDRNIEQIIITNSLTEKNTELLFNNLNLRINFITLAHFYEILFQKIPLPIINQSWFLENLSEGDKSAYENQKRFFDVIITILLGFISLFLIPIISLLIAITSKGPIFFIQTRAGKDNKPFKAVKFRTMYQNAENNGPQWAKANDPRITPLGKFLRKTRIDEIPQLWNILTGEMSFVGPRPERPEFINELVKQIPFYKERLLVKPGLTGWAQVLGPSYGGSEKETLEKLQYDLYYIKNRSFFLDLGIILKTINTVLKGSGQ